MDTMEIVGALEARAKRVGLSIAEVCRRTRAENGRSVAPSTISRWKAGDTEPQIKVLRRLDAVIAAEEAELEARTRPPAQDRVLSAQV